MSVKLEEELRSAIEKDDVDALSTLIKCDVDINKTIFMNKYTLLTYASSFGNIASVKALIAMGADVNLKDQYGESALVKAARLKENGQACMEILISAGADVNVDAPAFSIFRFYATHQFQGSLCILMEKGAKNCDSLLHYILEHSKFSDSLIIEVIKKSHKEFLYSRNSNHMTPLIIACQKGKVSCLKTLLRCCKDLVNCYDDEGRTALAHAAINGDIVCLEALIQSGSNVNFIHVGNPNDHVLKYRPERSWKFRLVYECYLTPLMFASLNGHLNVIVKLLEHGANVKQTAVNGVTAIYCAVERGHLKCVEALIKAGADVNNTCDLSLASLVGLHRHFDCLEYLVEKGADVTASSQILHEVLDHQDNDRLVELLLRKGVDANMSLDGSTPLMIAADKGHIKSLNILLREKVEIDCLQNHKIMYCNFNFKSALMMAAGKGNLQCLSSLIKAGANINQASRSGCTALSVACKSGQMDSVKALVAEGAELNPSNIQIEKPLFVAFDSYTDKAIDLVYWLLDHGADINDRNGRGDSFLHVLLERHHHDLKLMEKCIEFGADLACTNMRGETLLMTAAHSSSGEALELLLKRGSPINEVDIRGYTAVIYACLSGSAKCLEHLLNAGANVNFEPTKDTALSFAVQCNSIKCVKILGEHFTRKIKHSFSLTETFFSDLVNEFGLSQNVKMTTTLAAYGFISMKNLNVAIPFPLLVRERFLTSDSLQIFQQDKEMAPLEAAFRKDDVACVNYLLLNKFFYSTDISFMFSDSDFRQISEKDLYRTNSILQELTKEPWSLQELCLSHINSSVKPMVVGDERNEAVESLPIPNRFKAQLKFDKDLANFCPNSWKYLKYCNFNCQKLFDMSAKQEVYKKNVVNCRKECCVNRLENCFRFNKGYFDDFDNFIDSSDSDGSYDYNDIGDYDDFDDYDGFAYYYDISD